jgi:hypothetical protein
MMNPAMKISELGWISIARETRGKARSSLLMAKGAETHQSARVWGWIIPAGSHASLVIGCAAFSISLFADLGSNFGQG